MAAVPGAGDREPLTLGIRVCKNGDCSWDRASLPPQPSAKAGRWRPGAVSVLSPPHPTLPVPEHRGQQSLGPWRGWAQELTHWTRAQVTTPL